MKTRARKSCCLAMLATSLVLSLSCAGAVADVVAVVSAKSPLTELSRNQIANLFLGNASMLVNGEPVIPIDLAVGTPLRDEFYASYAAKSPAQIRAHWSKLIFTGRGQPPKEAASTSDLKKLIANNPRAIGYLDPGMIDASMRALPSP
ncbi:phosphate ABC transporter substrate-binding protein [Actimicrobium sp. CCC2.4]|uniref:phosphate ABC transporter substrate-binding protein n=1 Tax=Actimicrobium sp. CCC2.4 TaxID=3048606 RepID=UPI002AC9C9F7|nr:phosphate ABC transporter substrate-binding protein [Actimicrobium sp. CCC2.4]MEB0135268.1 phosphate ABC transporter substrate-binding protein [Actimicrobium sp. CCC2.4]WPX31060.1 phosphate ABC transporter substrate-binding protein [Actimicrobium sp. CCC2.4]